MRRYKLVCSLDYRDVLFQTLLWLLIVIVTLALRPRSSPTTSFA